MNRYISACNPFEVNRRSGGTSRLDLQSWRVRLARINMQPKRRTCMLRASCRFLVWLAACFILISCTTYSLNPEGGSEMFLRNFGWLSGDYTALHPSLKFIILWSANAVPTSPLGRIGMWFICLIVYCAEVIGLSLLCWTLYIELCLVYMTCGRLASFRSLSCQFPLDMWKGSDGGCSRIREPFECYSRLTTGLLGRSRFEISGSC
jgi:hypothetical protein